MDVNEQIEEYMQDMAVNSQIINEMRKKWRNMYGTEETQ